MTPEEKEGNKLIAQYLGPSEIFNDSRKGKITLYCKYNATLPHCEIHELKYHTSFDWLMPVIKKVYNQLESDYKINPNDETPETFDEAAYNHTVNLLTAAIDFDINTLFQAVVEAIKFINQTKNP